MRPDDERSREQLTSRRATVVLLGLTILGMGLRSVAIGREPLWSDESLTAVLVRYPWWSFPFTSVDATPPLFYWLQKALVPEGSGPVAWRLVSLVAGIATIPLTYWLGRELKSRGAGLVAAGLVAVSAPLVDYAQEARAYALCVMMITGSAAALAALAGGRLAGDARRAERWRMLMLFGLFTTLAAWSHFIAIFWIFPALLLLRFAADGERRTIAPREMVVTIAAMLPFLAVELRRQFIFRSQQDSFAWLTQLGPLEILRILGEQWLPFAKVGGNMVAIAGLALVAILLWTVRGQLAAWIRARWMLPAIVAALMVGPAGLWLLGEIAAPVAMPRTFLPASIGFAALIGVAISSLHHRRTKVAVAASAILLSLSSALASGTARHKEQWAGAAAAVGAAPVIVTCANWKTPSFLAQARGDSLVATSYGDRALIVRQPGDTASWDRLYYERIQLVGHYPMRRARPIVLDPIAIRTTELTFVASDCSKIEREAFARWANLRQSRLMWSSPRTEDAADIRVERWQLGGRQPLAASIVR